MDDLEDRVVAEIVQGVIGLQVAGSTGNVPALSDVAGSNFRSMMAPGLVSTPLGKIEPFSSNAGKVLPLPLFSRSGTAGIASSGES